MKTCTLASHDKQCYTRHADKLTPLRIPFCGTGTCGRLPVGGGGLRVPRARTDGSTLDMAMANPCPWSCLRTQHRGDPTTTAAVLRLGLCGAVIGSPAPRGEAGKRMAMLVEIVEPPP